MAVVFAFFTLQVVCVGNTICLWCPSTDSFQFCCMLASNMHAYVCGDSTERRRTWFHCATIVDVCTMYGLLNSVKWTGVGMVAACARVYTCVRTPFINFYAPYFTEVIQNVRPLYCNTRNKWHAELETMYLNYVPEAVIQWHHFTLEIDPNVSFFRCFRQCFYTRLLLPRRFCHFTMICDDVVCLFSLRWPFL